MKSSNYERFPNNIFAPRKITVNDLPYTLYLARFNSLYNLYDYLKSDPQINKEIFRKLSSINGDSDFAGIPYDQAVEDLVGNIDPGYKEFLKLQKKVNGKNVKVQKYQTVRTLAGGHLNIPAYSMGNPLCYETEERISEPKFLKMHVTLSYSAFTSEDQVFNRAIIVTNILRSLEKAGYNVALNTFELSSCNSEIIHIVIKVKEHGGKLDMEYLYKSLCKREFLRRILFRILETLDVQSNWSFGYGHVCDEEFIRSTLKLDKTDFFIGTPSELEIAGRNLKTDFERAIRILHLEDKIDVEKSIYEFQKNLNDDFSLKRKK